MLISDAAMGLTPEQWHSDAELRDRWQRYVSRSRNAITVACRLTLADEDDLASLLEELADSCLRQVGMRVCAAMSSCM